ncbi:MAG: FAD-binding oxidoreductase [Magnetococcales bacterium]|nr:FAD-binding oxidoreductase [Magnetococcales bacterium]
MAHVGADAEEAVFQSFRNGLSINFQVKRGLSITRRSSRLLHYKSWGGYPSTPQTGVPLYWGQDLLVQLARYPESKVLPFGNGRSQGDVCLNGGGILVGTRSMDRFLHFDHLQGTIICESGVLLGELMEMTVPRGWFPIVTPGTRFITIGGAIANDVHGKNHHRAGSFGNQVLRLELLRSDGQRLICSPTENRSWFEATIGGLGLTGLILWAELRLRPIANPLIHQQVIRFSHLDDFFAISVDSDQDYEYTLAWVDGHATGANLGRGVLTRGNHAGFFTDSHRQVAQPALQPSFPVTLPFSLVNPWTVSLFNKFYYHKPIRKDGYSTIHYRPFFYPLDGILHWNRVYGRGGFLQYQCVVPTAHGRDAMKEILSRIAATRLGSLIAVLKIFGAVSSVGLLSFPRPGVTLAIDFPNPGPRTLELLSKLDGIVRQAGGAVYPAKDARMSPEAFHDYYPKTDRFREFIDPRFSSQFWRRIRGGNP